MFSTVASILPQSLSRRSAGYNDAVYEYQQRRRRQHVEVGGFMAIKDALLPEFDHEMATARKVVERVPADKFGYKPHEKSMTMGHLATHIAEMPTWAITGITTD